MSDEHFHAEIFSRDTDTTPLTMVEGSDRKRSLDDVRETSDTRYGPDDLARTIKESADILKESFDLAKAKETTLLNYATFIERFSLIAVRLLQTINTQEEPSPSRTKQVGEQLFQLSLAGDQSPSPTGTLNLLYLLQNQYYPEPDAPHKDYAIPKSFNLVRSLIDLSPFSDSAPKEEYYLRLSQRLSDRVVKIENQIATVDEEIRDIDNANNRAVEKGKPAPFLLQKGIKTKQRDTLQASLIALFPDVTDVAPLEATVALATLFVRATPKVQLVAALIKSTVSLEKFAVTLLRDSPHSTKTIAQLPSTDKNTTLTTKVTVSLDPDRKALDLERVIVAINTVRRCTTELFATLRNDEKTPPTTLKKLGLHLRPPFTATTTNFLAPLEAMVRTTDTKVRCAALQLIMTPTVEEEDSSAWGYLLERPHSYPLLSRVVRLLLHVPPNSSEITVLIDALSNSPYVDTAVVPICKTSSNFLHTGHLKELADFLDSQILELHAHGTFLPQATLLATLAELARNETVRPALRHQIPHLEMIKQIGTNLSNKYPALRSILSESVRKIIRSFSQSLDDYYMDDESGDLEILIENFRYFLSHRDALQGVTGNEGIRNSIVIYGSPGVGKTYLVNCLKNELDLDLVILSAERKGDNQDRLDYTKSTIQALKNAAEPVILLIDEAESTVVDRLSPSATSLDREVTNYLLQEVDEIRRKFPHIFIVLATNYIERVDDAMIRPGRVDLEFQMKLPTKKSRESILRGALSREPLPFTLTEEQIHEMIDITDGFIPLRILQTIIETNRILVPRLREQQTDFSFSYDVLKERFLAEQARLQRYQSRVAQKKQLEQ